MPEQAGPLPSKEAPGLLPPPYTGPGSPGADNPAYISTGVMDNPSYMSAGLVAPGAGGFDVESEGAFSPPTPINLNNDDDVKS